MRKTLHYEAFSYLRLKRSRFSNSKLRSNGCTVLRAAATSPCAPCSSAGPDILRVEFAFGSCLAPRAFFTFFKVKFDLDARTLNNEIISVQLCDCSLTGVKLNYNKSNSSISSHETVFRLGS